MTGSGVRAQCRKPKVREIDWLSDENEFAKSKIKLFDISRSLKNRESNFEGSAESKIQLPRDQKSCKSKFQDNKKLKSKFRGNFKLQIWVRIRIYRFSHAKLRVAFGGRVRQCIAIAMVLQRQRGQLPKVHLPWHRREPGTTGPRMPKMVEIRGLAGVSIMGMTAQKGTSREGTV